MNEPTMYEHTPGPWIYEREDKVLGNRHFIVHPETECDDTTICTANYGKADALLIAAAPDILRERDELRAKLGRVKRLAVAALYEYDTLDKIIKECE